MDEDKFLAVRNRSKPKFGLSRLVPSSTIYEVYLPPNEVASRISSIDFGNISATGLFGIGSVDAEFEVWSMRKLHSRSPDIELELSVVERKLTVASFLVKISETSRGSQVEVRCQSRWFSPLRHHPRRGLPPQVGVTLAAVLAYFMGRASDGTILPLVLGFATTALAMLPWNTKKYRCYQRQILQAIHYQLAPHELPSRESQPYRQRLTAQIGGLGTEKGSSPLRC